MTFFCSNPIMTSYFIKLKDKFKTTANSALQNLSSSAYLPSSAACVPSLCFLNWLPNSCLKYVYCAHNLALFSRFSTSGIISPCTPAPLPPLFVFYLQSFSLIKSSLPILFKLYYFKILTLIFLL